MVLTPGTMTPPSTDDLRRVMSAKGYRIFDDFNLWGIRNADLQANTFNDLVGVMFRHNGQWIGRAWPATTDPGVYHREHPMNVHGVAILKPGQYRNAFRLGQHSGYPALQQNAPLDVWRDNDHNAALAPGHAHESGMFGINVHHASAEHTSTRVDKWSAGCQVLASPDDFAELMALASQNGGPFTYTLLEQGDFAT